MKTKLCALIALVAVVSVPAAFAQEKAAGAKKGKGKAKAAAQTVSAQLLKQLEPAQLTGEQTTKIKELGKTTEAAIKKLNTEAGLTPELLKKRREAMASLKDSDKKGKERVKAVDAAAGLNEAQAAAVAKVNGLRTKLKVDAVKLLSDDQKAKLPKEFMATLTGGRGGAAKTGDQPAAKKGKKQAQ